MPTALSLFSGACMVMTATGRSWTKIVHRIHIPILVFLVLSSLLPAHAQADWLESLKREWEEVQLPLSAAGGIGSAAGVLSEEEMVKGLREALAQGSRQAIAALGRDGGFLDNVEVRIPLPEALQKAEKLLRSLGQGKYADQFVVSLNRAAERAVPEAAGLFSDAIARMSPADAKAILKGPDDAATRYFRKTSEASLKVRFRPIVQAATDQAGVTAAYKALLREAGPALRMLGVQPTDLDAYVEDKAVDALFRMVAAEEKRIRQDPLARGSELLKKVFGTLVR